MRERARTDGAGLRAAIEGLLGRGVIIALIADAPFAELDALLSSGIGGPHKRNLFVLADGGAAVYGFDSASRPVLVEVRRAGRDGAMRWIVDELVQRYRVPIGELLVCSDDAALRVAEAAGATFQPVASVERLTALLDGQIALDEALAAERRRVSARMGDVAMPVAPVTDPRWSLVEDGFTVAREHEVESLFAVGNGTIGVRGALAEGSALSSPATFVAGVYARPGGEGNPTLFALPDGVRVRASVEGRPLSLEAAGAESHRRILDLRQGILWRDWRIRDPEGRRTRVRGLRIASLAARSALVQSVSLDSENFGGRIDLEAPRLEPVMPVAGTGEVVAWGAAEELVERSDGEVTRRLPPHTHREARWVLDVTMGGQYRFDRVICVVRAGRDEAAPDEAAAVEARALLGEGLDALVRAHVAAWEARWRDADVELDGDDEAQRALRFAAYHLISSANPTDARTSIGARGLTGPGYAGHVFWDTEIYMLPFFTYTDPATARTLLEYRHHTLPAARAKARRGGWEGALYAWESADTGEEETPRAVLMPTGEVLPVYCGDEEQHITADVAYAVWQYFVATGDEELLWEAGAEMLVEAARFWASRGELDGAGALHLRGLMGPDEYHHGVDDSAYTNAMARFTLERAVIVARLLLRRDPGRWGRLATQLGLSVDEVRRFARLARAVALPRVRDGVLEEFRGYFDLKVIPPGVELGAGRSVALDVALGLEGVRETQLVKQADVVLLAWLLEGRLDEEVRRASFRFYEARTAHSSSLSPGIHALVAARLGDVAAAELYFRQTREIDLANNMGNAAGGVHLASLGSLWQAAIFGFAGVTVERRGFSFAPALPEAWRRMRFALRRCGRRLVVTIGRDALEVAVDEGAAATPIAIRAGRAGEPVAARPGWRYVARRAREGWGQFEEVGRW